MRLVQSAFAVLFLGIPVAACTVFDAQGDCHKNPTRDCSGDAGGGEDVTMLVPRCDDNVKNGLEAGIDCGVATTCGKCPGDPCVGSDECKGGVCVDGVCCDGACDGLCEACNREGSVGLCSSLPVGDLDPQDDGCKDLGGCGEMPGHCRCNDGVKGEGEGDVDCGGVCGEPCTIGATCNDASDCASGFCSDGRCCESDCTQTPCVACDAEGHPGLCLPAPYGTVKNACETGNACSVYGQCLMANDAAQWSCSFAQQCASNRCFNGKCADCAAGDDCVAGQACLDGACVGVGKDGAGDSVPCQADAACQHGHCVDGVCCDTACEGPCMGCHHAYTDGNTGTCLPISKGFDPHDECHGPGDAATCDGAGACGKP